MRVGWEPTLPQGRCPIPYLTPRGLLYFAIQNVLDFGNSAHNSTSSPAPRGLRGSAPDLNSSVGGAWTLVPQG